MGDTSLFKSSIIILSFGIPDRKACMRSLVQKPLRKKAQECYNTCIYMITCTLINLSWAEAHLGISKAHSNTKLCMYVYADLCSGGTESVYILSTSLHVHSCSSLLNTSLYIATQLQFLLNVSRHVATQLQFLPNTSLHVHKFSSSPCTSLHVHSLMLKCAFEIPKCGAEMWLCPW